MTSRAPPRASLCPERYLVVECITTVAPRARDLIIGGLDSQESFRNIHGNQGVASGADCVCPYGANVASTATAARAE